MKITTVYQEWIDSKQSSKVHCDLELVTLKKLVNLNEIASANVFNQIESILYHLKETHYTKPHQSYLQDLKDALKSFKFLEKYVADKRNLQFRFTQIIDNQLELIPNDFVTIEEIEEPLPKQLNTSLSMLYCFYQYGVMHYSKNKKTSKTLEEIRNLLIQYNVADPMSHKNINLFFAFKYNTDTRSDIIKIAMQGLYDYFDTHYPEYEALNLCNEVMEHILKEEPKQIRYYTTLPENPLYKVAFIDNSLYIIGVLDTNNPLKTLA